MGIALTLAGRNIKLYFRDRASVFFSMLGALIVLLLYIFFLGDVQVQSIKQSMPAIDENDIRFLVNSWMIGGILSISSVTTSMGCLGTMVDDRLKGISRDFSTAPIKRWQLVMSYLLSAILSSFIICSILLIVGEVFLVVTGGVLLEAMAILKAFGLLALCCISYTAINCFLCTLVKTTGGFGGISTLLGTLIGFLSGSYMPIGVFPAAVQVVIKLLPYSYSAALFRMIFTRVPMDTVFGMAPADIRLDFEEEFGMRLVTFGREMDTWLMLAIIAVAGAIFFGLSIWRMSGRSKKA